MQLDELANHVVLLVKSALGPVLERVAAAEARLNALGDVRDRVVVLETKQAVPVMPVADPAIAEVRGLVERFATPITEDRISQMIAAAISGIEPKSLEDSRVHEMNTRINSLESDLRGGLRAGAERIVALESKAVPDVEPLIARIKAIEDKPAPKTPEDPRIAELAARLASTESALSLAISKEAELRDRLTALEKAPKVDHTKDIDTLRERLQVVEVRGVVPGPAGPAGKDGAAGRDGRDGKDGVELKDLSMTQEHDRAFTLRARMGGEMKEFGTFTVPVHIYRGVWVEGKTYERGDGVTWGGSHWHCNSETTDKPGDGSKDWTLTVKRGRDGKDGKDAEGPLPVVKR